MLSLEFERNFVAYLAVASLTVSLWDIMDNIRNDYRLLFRLRLGLPTIIYFLSRVSVLGYALAVTIVLTTPIISCAGLDASIISFLIIGLISTPFLAYLRLCAVWKWNYFIVGFFGASWLAVAASGFILINSAQNVSSQRKSYCTDIITDRQEWQAVLAPVITNLFNHTVMFLAITYGVCKNTMGRDLSFRDRIRLMLGEGLPMFSKALLHDSQVSYMIIMIIGATTLAWSYIWAELQPISSFRLALVPPFIILENIMICRVFRNTKLGLYSNALLQSNDPTIHTHAGPNGMISSNSRYNHTDAHFTSITPIQIAVSQNVECKIDYPPSARSNPGRSRNSLDFGMV